MKTRQSTKSIVLGALFASAALVGCDLGLEFEPLQFDDGGGYVSPSPPYLFAPSVVRAVQGHPDSVDVRVGVGATLTAELGALPPGNDARFEFTAGSYHGTLVWTPTTTDSGPFVVGFIASTSSATAHATTTIYVTNHLIDTPPRVIAPAETTVTAGTELRLSVYGEDPDGDPILTWQAIASHSYVYNPWRFQKWPFPATLVFQPTKADTVLFTFQATNFLTGSATTRVEVLEAAGASRSTIP